MILRWDGVWDFKPDPTDIQICPNWTATDLFGHRLAAYFPTGGWIDWVSWAWYVKPTPLPNGWGGATGLALNQTLITLSLWQTLDLLPGEVKNGCVLGRLLLGVNEISRSEFIFAPSNGVALSPGTVLYMHIEGNEAPGQKLWFNSGGAIESQTTLGVTGDGIVDGYGSAAAHAVHEPPVVQMMTEAMRQRFSSKPKKGR